MRSAKDSRPPKRSTTSPRGRRSCRWPQRSTKAIATGRGRDQDRVRHHEPRRGTREGTSDDVRLDVIDARGRVIASSARNAERMKPLAGADQLPVTPGDTIVRFLAADTARRAMLAAANSGTWRVVAQIDEDTVLRSLRTGATAHRGLAHRRARVHCRDAVADEPLPRSPHQRSGHRAGGRRRSRRGGRSVDAR